MRDTDDFLAECDDVIADWRPGPDAAQWAADGSHQPDELDGDYYGYDVAPQPGTAAYLLRQISRAAADYEAERRAMAERYARWADEMLPVWAGVERAMERAMVQMTIALDTTGNCFVTLSPAHAAAVQGIRSIRGGRLDYVEYDEATLPPVPGPVVESDDRQVRPRVSNHAAQRSPYDIGRRGWQGPRRVR